MAECEMCGDETDDLCPDCGGGKDCCCECEDEDKEE